MRGIGWFLAAGILMAQAPPLPDKVEPYPVVADIEWPEGPMFDSVGNLYFVNYIRRGTIGRKSPDGTVSIWLELKGQVNALKPDREGNIIVAHRDGHSILRVSPDKRVQLLADKYENRPLLGPNDLCLDKRGNIYFTDPTGSSQAKPIGSVYRISTDSRLHRVDTGMAFPNGIAVSPDDTKLYVGETGNQRILVYDLGRDGSISKPRVFRQYTNGLIDGMAFDEFGRLWVARWEEKNLDVLAPDGNLVGSIPAGGDKVSNLCWWGKSVYVTVVGQHSIHRIDVGVGQAR